MSKKKLTKHQRLMRDPMNQKRGKVKAWAKKHGAKVEERLFRQHRYLRLVGFEPGSEHPNKRVRSRAFR